MATMTCNDVGCNGDPEYTVTVDSLGFEGLDLDVEELKLCQACYIEALRMAREQAALSFAAGSAVAKRKVELLDEEIARMEDLGKKP